MESVGHKNPGKKASNEMGLDGSIGEDSEKGWCEKSVLGESQRGRLLGQRRGGGGEIQ